MTISEREVGHYIAVSREMARRAAESADLIDAERRLPQDLAADMADEGLFRLLVPRSLGGAELDFIEYLRIVEIFARADGSVAWCVNQNNVFATDSVRMPVETAQADLGPSPGGNKQRSADAAKLCGRNRRRLPGDRPLELQQRHTSRQLGGGANPLGSAG